MMVHFLLECALTRVDAASHGTETVAQAAQQRRTVDVAQGMEGRQLRQRHHHDPEDERELEQLHRPRRVEDLVDQLHARSHSTQIHHSQAHFDHNHSGRFCEYSTYLIIYLHSKSCKDRYCIDQDWSGRSANRA